MGDAGASRRTACSDDAGGRAVQVEQACIEPAQSLEGTTLDAIPANGDWPREIEERDGVPS